MLASESGLFPATLLVLMLMMSEVIAAEAAGWQKLKTSNGGTSVPLTGQDIGQPWCKMQPLQQTVRRRGCEAKTVSNNLCNGQCRSFYIPFRKRPFESCSFCTPINSTTINVVLNCPTRKKKQVVKKVKIITECSCRVCGQRYI